MKKHCVRNFISLCLSKVGYYIGCHPQWYIASFFLITIVLGTGFFKFSKLTDMEYLFTPINGRAKLEKKSLESMFPTNFKNLARITAFGRGGYIIAESNNEGYMNNNAAITELVELDNIIQNINIFWNNSFLRYKNFCIKTENNECSENFVSHLKRKLEHFKSGKEYLRYPIERSTFDVKVYAINLGGVLSNQTGYVEDFKAVRLLYLLDDSNEERNRIALMWEKEFIEIMSNVKFHNIQFYIFSKHSQNIEANQDDQTILPLAIIFVPIMILFAVISCLSLDSVTSKPLIAIGGFLSSFLATVAAFGLLLYCNIEYVTMNITAFFLLTAVGIDDSFVLLASWKRTNEEDSVEKRMSETFSDAAVSVTITSLTNFLAFCLGLLSPFQAIRIFCIYTSLAILFDYIYQIFFFGGIMALDGYREKFNMHSFFLHTVQRNESSEKKNDARESDIKKFKQSQFAISISENLATLLGKKVIKIIIMIIVFCSLAISVIRMIEIKQGLEFIDIFPYSSYATKFLKAHYKYFTDYSHQVSVVFNQTLDYSNPNVQKDIENILRNFESAPFAKESILTECWLREYLFYINNGRINYLLMDYNVNDTKGFFDGFKEVFLKLKLTSRFENDILWNEERYQILASRCFVTYGNVRNGSSEKLLLEFVRKIAAESKYDVFVFNPWFIIYDSYLNMPMICLQSLSIAIIIIILVFVVIMVDLSCIIFVALNVIFILIQTIGYMSWWNVNLDQISVIILTVSAGLCVDYSAHIAYAYKSCGQKESKEKIKASLQLAGYPVLQGCMTTILGVIFLKFGPSYIYVIFFKIIFLIILFAAFNGLIVLPVMLSISDSLYTICNKKSIE